MTERHKHVYNIDLGTRRGAGGILYDVKGCACGATTETVAGS